MIQVNNLSLLFCCWAAADGGNSTVASRTEEQNELDKHRGQSQTWYCSL